MPHSAQLHLSWSPSASLHIELWLHPWSQGIDGYSEVNGERIRLDPLADLGLPLQALLQAPQAQPWAQQLPSELLPALLAFDATYPGHLYTLLWWASRERWPCDLLLSEPWLLALLWYWAPRQGWSLETIQELGTGSRLALLAACGLPGTQRVRNLLKKLQGIRLFDSDKPLLTRSLSCPGIEVLSHQPRLDLPLLRAIFRNPRLLRYRWLRHWPTHRSWTLAQRWLADLDRMAEQLQITDLEQRLLQCPHPAAVRRLHDRLAAQLNARTQNQDSRRWTFLDPPFSGTASIIPLTTSDQLAEEGRSQRHCVASYALRILAGEYFVYQVLEPQRSTLGLRRTRGNWELDQLYRADNQAVTLDTLEAVRHWLHQAQRAAAAP